MLAGRSFAHSDRLARFLRHVVEQTIEGRADSLKETTVGVDVFGRKPGYDPRLDGVVRTEAIKLRARLKEYYEGEGARDSLRIDLPKGGYVPAFSVSARGPAGERTVSGRWIVVSIVAVIAIAVSVAAVMLFARPRGRIAPPPSIAVLPFLDMSATHDQEYLCDGMTAQIIDALSRIPNFQVVARSSVFALKGKQQDVREVGQRLNVRSVLEGSVQRSGERVRVTAQLINVSDGFQFWSQTYDRDLKDIFALEDDLSRAIVGTLEIKLARPLPAAPQADPEAFNLYLQGRYWHYKWQPDAVRHAITFFDQAIAKDPRYALAYAGLADSYTWLGFFRDRPDDVMPKARAAADRAIELDPRLDSAYVARAEVESLYDHDWDAADRDFKRAFAVNPACGDAMFAQALTYDGPLGRTREAIEEMKRAQSYDPLNPVTNTYLGVAYLLDRQYDAAIDQLRKTIAQSPDFHEPHAMLFYAYIAAHRAAEARAELNKLEAVYPIRSSAVDEAETLALEGKKDQARAVLRHPDRDRKVFLSPFKIACAHFAAGDDDAGFKELDRAYEEHDGMLAFVKVWPELDRIRSDPRYRPLLAKMRLQ